MDFVENWRKFKYKTKNRNFFKIELVDFFFINLLFLLLELGEERIFYFYCIGINGEHSQRPPVNNFAAQKRHARRIKKKK